MREQMNNYKQMRRQHHRQLQQVMSADQSCYFLEHSFQNILSQIYDYLALTKDLWNNTDFYLSWLKKYLESSLSCS